MATRRYSVAPQDPDYNVTEAVGAATVTKSIELTVDFGALASAGLSDVQAKMQVLMALRKLESYIETRHTWQPA